MPIIEYYSDHGAAQDAFALLEANGVPTYLKSAGWGDRGRVALVVLFEEQVEDAVALLKNPEHEVRNPVDMEVFYQAENSGDSLKVMGKVLLLTLVGVVGAIVLVGMLVL